MLEITDREFSKLKYAVHSIPLNESCCDRLPDLRNVFLEYPVFGTATLTNDLAIRFIVFCYDRKSPFVEKLDNIMERKREIFSYLKVPTEPEDIQNIIKSADRELAKVIYHFCKLQDSLTYFALVTTTEAYINMSVRMGDDISSAADSKQTLETLAKLSKVEERIEDLSRKLFQQDVAMKEFIGGVLVAEGRKRKIFSEDWAE
jgi:hypothetical protein